MRKGKRARIDWLRIPAVSMVVLLEACSSTCPSGTTMDGALCRKNAALSSAGTSGEGTSSDGTFGEGTSLAGTSSAAPSAGASSGQSDPTARGAAGRSGQAGESASAGGAPGATAAGIKGGAAASAAGASGNEGYAGSAVAASFAGSGAAGGSENGGAAGAAAAGDGTEMQSAPNCVPEICDNIDNDCDQKIDEDVIRPCGPPMMIGICKPGTETCKAGAWAGTCVGAVNAGTEICDAEGLDENCNGMVNETCECTAGATQPCGMTRGACISGMQTCTSAGRWPADCSGSVQPSPETCDGQDNDCDGNTDEDVLNACGGCGDLANAAGSSCTISKNSCKSTGSYRCVGQATVCDALPPTGTAEVCNGEDDDCDGSVDEGLMNVCGGSCLVQLTDMRDQPCRVQGVGNCNVAGTWKCSGTSGMQCISKNCEYECVDGSNSVTTNDPCGWAASPDRSANHACVPTDPSCG
jgi:hypothetical protein